MVAPESGGPFCSPRCQTVDLERWLDGSYRIAGDEQNSPRQPDGAREAEES